MTFETLELGKQYAKDIREFQEHKQTIERLGFVNMPALYTEFVPRSVIQPIPSMEAVYMAHLLCKIADLQAAFAAL